MKCASSFFTHTAVAAVLLAPALAKAQTYTVTDLGTLGGATSAAYAINSSGQVTGDTVNASNSNLAFLWSPTSPNAPTGTMQDLGGLSNYSRFGRAINASGQVAGYQANGSFSYATLWTAAGKYSKLGRYESYAYALNDVGEVVGTTRTSNTGPLVYVLWKGGTAYTIGSDNVFQGMGINAIGEIAFNGSQLFLPSVANGTSGATYNIGVGSFAINASGQVVGDAGASGYLWTPNVANGSTGTLTYLASLAPYTQAEPYALNVSAQVVGAMYASGVTQHAFVWDSVNGMQDLNSLIPANSGWVLTQANGINDHGQIVGVGTHNSLQHAFLLTP